MSINNKFNDFNKEVIEYISAKLPGLNAETVQEIAAFIACRVGVFVHDACLDRDDYWMSMFKVRNSMELEKVKTRHQELINRNAEMNAKRREENKI